MARAGVRTQRCGRFRARGLVAAPPRVQVTPGSHHEWRHLSKVHPLELPGQGAHVRLELDNKGFIRTLQVLEQAPVTSDRTITRLSVLKTAAAFLGAMAQVHEEVRSDHVLVLADKWLA